jgi:hypothetical protein
MASPGESTMNRTISAACGLLAAFGTCLASSAAQPVKELDPISIKIEVNVDLGFADAQRYVDVRYYDSALGATWDMRFAAAEPRPGTETVFVRGSGETRQVAADNEGNTSVSATKVVLGFGVPRSIGERELIRLTDDTSILIERATGRQLLLTTAPGILAGTTTTRIVDPVNNVVLIDATVAGGWDQLFGSNATMMLPYLLMTSWGGAAGHMDSPDCNPTYETCRNDAINNCNGWSNVNGFEYSCDPSTGAVVCKWAGCKTTD